MNIDFLTNDHGTIVTFLAVSEDAKEFSKVAFGNAMTFGPNTYVVEHRFAQDIYDDLTINQGFVLGE
jgi:hypothetical protein